MAEENDLVFREVQRMGSWIRWAVALVMVVAVGFNVFAVRTMLSGQGKRDVPAVILLIVVGMGVPVAITLLLFGAKLETEVRGDGLYVRFSPFHISYRKFAAQDLEEYYAREYRPIVEHGGWGIRWRFGRRGRAYNMSGNKGVQLVFRGGKRLLIGSHRADELAEAIDSITGRP